MPYFGNAYNIKYDIKKRICTCELINWTFFSELDMLGFPCLIL